MIRLPRGLKESFASSEEAKDSFGASEEGKASFSPAGRGLRRRLPALLVAVAIVLAGAGAWCTVQANELRSSASARNKVLADPAATAEVTSAVSVALNKMFSYSYDKTEVTAQAAAAVLRPPALDTYHQLFGQVRALAPQQKLVLTTRVVATGVQTLSDDKATLLVFLDQAATRADTGTTSTAASQLSVTAQRENRTWVITGLEPR